MRRTRAGQVLGVVLAASFARAGSFAPPVASALATEKRIYVSVRSDEGSWSEPKPAWFMYDGEAVYFTIAPESSGAARVRAGEPIRVRVGRPDGPGFEGVGTIVSDPAEIERMAEAYRKKYWIAWFGFFRPRPARVAAGRTIAVKVVPAESPGARER